MTNTTQGKGKVNRKSIVFLIAVILLFSIFAFIMLLRASGRSSSTFSDIEKIKIFAIELEEKELYTQAIDEYKKYLERIPVHSKEAENMLYRIGDIYMENIADYENALYYYLKIRNFHPKSKLMPDVQPKIVACLENLGKSVDAQQELDEYTSIDGQNKPKAEDVIAVVGKREITNADLNKEISKLPASVREEFIDPSRKLEFLKNYLVEELLYTGGIRKGFDRDKKVLEDVSKIKKQLIIRKYYSEEISSKIEISDAEKKLYYEQNREKLSEGEGKNKRQKSYEECADSIEGIIRMEKVKEEGDKLLKRMQDAQEVKIFEDRIR